MIRDVIAEQRYIGLSSDEKPLGSVRAGSTFQELDTGRKWIFDGEQWVEDLHVVYALGRRSKG